MTLQTIPTKATKAPQGGGPGPVMLKTLLPNHLNLIDVSCLGFWQAYDGVEQKEEKVLVDEYIDRFICF